MPWVTPVKTAFVVKKNGGLSMGMKQSISKLKKGKIDHCTGPWHWQYSNLECPEKKPLIYSEPDIEQSGQRKQQQSMTNHCETGEGKTPKQQSLTTSIGQW